MRTLFIEENSGINPDMSFYDRETIPKSFNQIDNKGRTC